jgi:hypothetical protein
MFKAKTSGGRKKVQIRNEITLIRKLIFFINEVMI